MRDLDRLLAQTLRAGQQRWPSLPLAIDCFLGHLAERLPEAAPIAALEKLHAADFYLACACANGDGRAIALLESHYFSDVDVACARRGLTRTQADEVKQILRQQLFVASADAPPKIAEYSGSGQLRAWLQVTAVRAALKLIRKRRHEVLVDDDRLLEMPAGPTDPELEFMKVHYQAAFKKAFQEAVASLADRPKNVMRQHFVDGVTIVRLAALYDVHRATVARWIAEAQDEVLGRTRRALMSEMRVSRAECDSILRLVRSRMNLTMKSLWARNPA